MNKPYDIEEIRLPGSIRTHEKHAALELNVHVGEVSPVFKMNPGDPKALSSGVFHDESILATIKPSYLLLFQNATLLTIVRRRYHALHLPYTVGLKPSHIILRV